MTGTIFGGAYTIVSFYMGTNLQSLVASPVGGRNYIGAVVKDGKIYGVWDDNGYLKYYEANKY
jgi:methylglyoxal synthase